MPITGVTTNRSVTRTWKRKIWANGVLTEDSTSSSDATVNTFFKEKNWARTPNFWQLRRDGKTLPDNNYDLEQRVVAFGELHFQGEQSVGNTRVFREIIRHKGELARMENTGFTISEYDLNSRLISRARSSDFSIPVLLAEAGRTVQMVTGAARTLGGVIYDLRRGNLRSAMGRLELDPTESQVRRHQRRHGFNPTQTAANYWLQLQYGWKPLLSDAKAAAEALAEMHLRDERSRDTSVRVGISNKLRTTMPDFLIESSPAYRGVLIQEEEASRRAVWRFRLKPADTAGLFGLLNPLEVVWELVPFSFVADWFLPIGDYLSSLDAPMRFEHIGGTKGYRKFVHATVYPLTGTYPDGGPPLHCDGGGGISNQLLVIQRRKLTSIPSPQISQMTFDPHINATRATSAIALLRQQASRL